MALSVLSLVRSVLNRLAVHYEFTIEERLEELGVFVSVSPNVEEAGGVLIHAADWPMKRGEPLPIELAPWGTFEIVGDVNERWVTRLEELLEGVMENGYRATIWRYKRWKWAGPIAGTRLEIQTRSGPQVIQRDLSFWPFTKFLPSEVVGYAPYSRADT